jgi:hypothetical protein
VVEIAAAVEDARVDTGLLAGRGEGLPNRFRLGGLVALE